MIKISDYPEWVEKGIIGISYSYQLSYNYCQPVITVEISFENQKLTGSYDGIEEVYWEDDTKDLNDEFMEFLDEVVMKIYEDTLCEFRDSVNDSELTMEREIEM